MASTQSNRCNGYRASDAFGPSAHNNAGVSDQLQDLSEVVRRRDEVITQLQTSSNGTQSGNNTQMGSASSIKAPPVTCYSGKPSDDTSEEAKASSTPLPRLAF